MSFEEIEQSNTDASNEVSSEPQMETAEEQPEAEAQPAQASQSEDTQKPFHEHPRFRELIEQKNQIAERATQYEKQLADLQRRLDTMSKPEAQKAQEDALIARLKGIDPEFGSRIEQLQSKLSKLDELESKLQSWETRSVETEAKSQLSQLYTEHKVPANLQARYEREIRMIAAENPNIQLTDLPKVFKKVHEEYTSFIDSVKRSERESYVTGKKADASAPVSQPKGKPASANKNQFSKDPAKARQEMVEEVLKSVRGSNEVG
jgi:hypothetical protein